MTIHAAAWCIACGAPPTVAVTIERHGVLAHYGSCWDHVTAVATRARADAERIDRVDATRRLTDATRARRASTAELEQAPPTEAPEP